MTFGKRLTQLREENGYNTRKKFAEKLSIPETTLRNYETDAREPGHTFLKQMSDFFNVSADYLLGLTEEKEKFSSYQLKSSEIDHIKKYRSLDPHGKSHVDSILDWESARVEELKKQKARITELEVSASSTIIELPAHPYVQHLAEYFRGASAGNGIFILGNEAASKIAVPEQEWDKRADYVIQVNGDSMLPDYKDGDNVMVSQHIELKHGDVGIFVVNGNAFIKEYGKTELISRNPEFPNIQVNESDNIVCLGKVVGKLEGEYEIISD